MIYIHSNSTEAAYYFAVEEYLMTQKKFDDTVFMFWRTAPTIMIGSGQVTQNEINKQYVENNNVTLVRRQSGGGAIYTDMGGWQFTYVLPRKNAEIPEFRVTGKDILIALITLGIDAQFNDRNDILVGSRKISGNARHLNSGYILHHGSLLYNTDIEAMVSSLTPDPEKLISKGIQSVRQRVCNISEIVQFEDFEQAILSEILKNYNFYELSEEDEREIQKIANKKYRSDEWTYSVE